MTALVAFLLHFALCVLDLQHCTRLAFTAGGLRCVEVTERPSCEQERGFHLVLGTPVCTRDCGGDE
jgi:hypothetical protein